MEFELNKPIYIQIADEISRKILRGEFKPMDRIPSVREWGATIGVNPNTVARSYELLTDQGLIFNQRGLGFFVASDALETLKDNENRKFINEELPAFKLKAELLGINLKELL